MSAGIFVFFKEYVSRLYIKGICAKLLSSFSSCSLGIYLLHAFIIERLNKLGLTTFSFTPALSIPVIAVSGFIVCWLIVLVFKIMLSKIKNSYYKDKSPVPR
jgi:surface polysaccharide O-acyltransferase-like enzyme